MRGAWLGLLLVGLAAIGFGVLVTPRDATAAVPDGGAVIAGNRSDPGRQLELLRQAGVPWVSLLLDWSAYEDVKGDHLSASGYHADQWRDLGTTLDLAERAGLNVLVVFSRPPRWANGTGNPSDPPRPEAYPEYAAFLAEVARTYGDRIDAYGTWNEPNIDRGWTGTDAAAYARLHRLAYAAVKSEDPSARVLLGPLAGNGLDPFGYITRAYDAGVRGSVDIVGWNSYPPGTPETPVSPASGAELSGQFTLARMLRLLDPGRRVWITETSWSTCATCRDFNVASMRMQADYLLRTYAYKRRYLHGFVERVFWYNVADGERRNDWSSNHGLVLNGSFAAKPAYTAAVRMPVQLQRAPSRVIVTRTTSRANVSRLRVAPRRGSLQATAGLRMGRSGAYVVEGYWRGKWTRVARGAARTGTLRVAVLDRGYRALRVRARARGDTRFAIRTVRVGKAPALSSK